MKVVAISDQHGHLLDVPACDLLIVAGDQCPDNIGGVSARHDPDRQWRWFMDVWLPWRDRQPAKHCLLTWGNHDYAGQQHRNVFCGPMTRIVCDAEVQIDGLRIYLTPWSNAFMKWAFMREPAALAEVYAQMPCDLDILVSHQPPLGFGSQCRYLDPRDSQWKTEQVGSIELRDAIDAKRPHAVICGHIHSGYGSYNFGTIPVFNVSVVDEGYSLVHPPTVISERQPTHVLAASTNAVDPSAQPRERRHRAPEDSDPPLPSSSGSGL